MHTVSRPATEVGLAHMQDRDWATVVACGICYVLSVGTLLLYSFGVFVRPLVAEFHWTRSQVTLALSIGQLTVALSSPIWGYLVDRFGPRSAILPAIVALSLGFGSLALLTPHLWHLYLIFAFFPFFGGGSSPVGFAAVISRTFNRHLGLALGLSLMGIGLGATVLPSLAQKLVAAFGWRMAYAAMGAMTFLITFPAAWFGTRHARKPLPVRDRSEIAIAPLIWTRAFLLMCVIFILLAVATGGTFAGLVPMMIDRGFTPAAAARVAGVAGIAVLIGRGGIGWLLDRFNAARLLACVSLTIVTALLLLAYGHGNVVGYAASFMMGSVLGAEVDFTAYLVRRYFGNPAFGRMYGLSFGIYAIGVGFGPLLLSMSFDRMGGYRPALLFFVALCAIAALTTFALPSYSTPSHVPLTEPVI